MKTLTEFPVVALKNALKTRSELKASGKTEEELPAAVGEALKLEGDKLALLLAALDLVESRQGDLKRVVVYALAEGEAAPSGSVEKDGKVLVVEFYPPVEKPGAREAGRFGDRDGKRGGRDGKGGKRGGGRDAGGGGGRDSGGPGGAGGRGRRPDRPGGAPVQAGKGIITPVSRGITPVSTTPVANDSPAPAETPSGGEASS